MLEATGDIFTQDCDAVCITTNGFVKANGQAVMGRGCAKQAARLIPELPSILGTSLEQKGNTVQPLYEQEGTVLVSFPVKPVGIKFSVPESVVAHMRSRFREGAFVPGWAAVADVELIKQSAHQLVELTDRYGWQRVVLPRPGCGAGELRWQEIKPLLTSILDDRFVCMTF